MAPAAQKSGSFLLRFLLLAALCEAIFFRSFADGPLFAWYLAMHARAAGFVLRTLGIAVEVHGTTLSLGSGTFEIARGCDATRALGLLCAAIMAFPASWRSKGLAIVKGTVLLLAVNLVRILSLMFVSRVRPELFEHLHLAFWPLLLILTMLWFWTTWARREVQV